MEFSAVPVDLDLARFTRVSLCVICPSLANGTSLSTLNYLWRCAASEVVSSEIRVRINNLPKKMNVHRDLRSAFRGVHGIINISPAVLGNKKTRDPVCKGFGFVDFKSLEDANRYVILTNRNIL